MRSISTGSPTKKVQNPYQVTVCILFWFADTDGKRLVSWPIQGSCQAQKAVKQLGARSVKHHKQTE